MGNWLGLILLPKIRKKCGTATLYFDHDRSKIHLKELKTSNIINLDTDHNGSFLVLLNFVLIPLISDRLKFIILTLHRKF